MDELYREKLKYLLHCHKGITKGPWRYQQIIDGQESRALMDGTGYVFGRIDDVQNGEFCAAAEDAMQAIVYLMLRVEALEIELEEAYSIFNG